MKLARQFKTEQMSITKQALGALLKKLTSDKLDLAKIHNIPPESIIHLSWLFFKQYKEDVSHDTKHTH